MTGREILKQVIDMTCWHNPKLCVNTVQQCKNRNKKYIFEQAAAAFGVSALVTS